MPTEAGINARTTPRKCVGRTSAPVFYRDQRGRPGRCSPPGSATSPVAARRQGSGGSARSATRSRRDDQQERDRQQLARRVEERDQRIGSCRGWAPSGSRRRCSRWFCSANAMDHSTVTIPAAHATGSHLGEIRWPSGKRRNVHVSRTPKIGTHVQLLSQIAKVPPGAPGCVIVAQYPYSVPSANDEADRHPDPQVEPAERVLRLAKGDERGPRRRS